MIWRFLILLFFTFNTFLALAQSGTYSSQDKKALKYYQEAAALMRRVQYPESIEPLKKAVARDDNFIEAWQALGQCYAKVGNGNEAIRSYEKSISIDPDSRRAPQSYFILADLYFLADEYEKAIQYAEIYISKRQNETKNIASLNKIIGNAKYVMEAQKSPLPYDPQPLPGKANYFEQQYFPVLTVDQKTLIFTGRNDGEDIYISRKQENGDWSMPANISQNINTHLNEGACTISADGRTLIFTSCQGRRSIGSCDLFVCYKVGNDWSRPKNLGVDVNSTSWDVQPTLSADGSTIYFVSDRPGGKGGKDIWTSTKDEVGKWTSPKNLGSPINTASDEISPFIHVNGEALYFSSRGHAGMGGYDIFMSEFADSTWSEPVNMGYPLNDKNDQVSLYISSDGLKGYYTIEKMINGAWSSRLYSFDVPEQFRIKKRSAYTYGHVRDKDTGAFLGADIKLYDLSTSNLLSRIRSDEKSGEYTVVLTEGKDYGLYVEKKGYLFSDYSFSFEKLESFDQDQLEIELQPIKEGAHMVLNNIYFEFDSFELKKESFSELQTVYDFLKANRNLSIEIQGYTDNKGSEKYNLQLSENRAKSVYDFLRKKRVPERMLSYKGLGATNFIAENDSDSNRAKNRRIEFKISQIRSQ